MHYEVEQAGAGEEHRPAVGTHTELLGTDPLYAELAATQFLVAAD